MMRFKGWIVFVDGSVFEWMQHHRVQSMDIWMRRVSAWTSPWSILLWAMAAAVIFVLFRKGCQALKVLAGTALGNVLIEPLKSIFIRSRPTPIIPIVTRGFSFPSGHAIASMVFLS